MDKGLDVGIQSLFPLKVEMDEGSWWVPQPTVGQALIINGCLPYFEDSDFAERIRFELNSWLPADLLSKLKEVGWEFQVGIISDLIQRCVPEGEENEVRDGIYERKVDVNYLLAEYRAWYHTNPLTETWGFFLAQAKVLPIVKANIELSNVSWYTAAKSTKQFNELFKRAGFTLKEEEKPVEGFNVAEEIARMNQLQMFNG